MEISTHRSLLGAKPPIRRVWWEIRLGKDPACLSFGIRQIFGVSIERREIPCLGVERLHELAQIWIWRLSVRVLRHDAVYFNGPTQQSISFEAWMTGKPRSYAGASRQM